MSFIEPYLGCHHNAHLFGMILPTKEIRSQYIDHMKKLNIQVVPHYIPLHSSPAGRKFGEFTGKDMHTSTLSEQLIRLPLFYDMTDDQIEEVITKTLQFFKQF